MENQFNSWNNIYGNSDNNENENNNENGSNNYSGNDVNNYSANNSGSNEPVRENNYNPYGSIYEQSRNNAGNYSYNYGQSSNNINLNGQNMNNQNGANLNQPIQKNKKSSSFGKTMGKTVAIALIFGLVAGSVFTGVSVAGNKLLGVNSPIESSGEQIKDSATYNPTDGALSQTSAGNASDLVDVSGIVGEVMPSVVAITNTATVSYRSFWGQTYSQDSQSCGSGFIIDQTEDYIYIATNNHVVADAESLTVQFVDEEVVEAQIRGTDPSDDLAVVQVAVKDVPEETLNTIKVASLADSENVTVGEAAIAIGNALGYGQTVTTGVVSALGRSVTTSDDSTGQTVTNSNLIQTDAAINPGNSGGALLNSNGLVIGINSVKYASTEVEGIGYAIPITDALPILETIIKDGEYTNTQSAYLGIQGLDVSSEMAAYNIPVGIYVSSVYPGSGAQKAGIQEGDIITKIDNNKISTMKELQSYLRKYSAGDEIEVAISRQQGNGYEEQNITVILSSEKDLK